MRNILSRCLCRGLLLVLFCLYPFCSFAIQVLLPFPYPFGGGPLEFSTVAKVPSVTKVVQMASNSDDDGNILISSLSFAGPGAASFEIVNDTCLGHNLYNGEDCLILIRFIPQDVGDYVATLEIASNANTPLISYDLAGEATAAGLNQPVIFVNPPSLSFGQVYVGDSSAAQFIEIQNVGSADLIINGIIMETGTAFSVFDQVNCVGINIPPAGSCFVFAKYIPVVAGGVENDFIQIFSNIDPIVEPYKVPVIGQSFTPLPDILTLPSSLDFGDVTLGNQSSQLAVLVQNIGHANLLVTNVNIDNPSFHLIQDSCTDASIIPQGLCLLQLQFVPTGAGVEAGSITFTSNDSLGVLPITLSGEGVEPILTVAPSAPFDFGNVNTGESKVQIFTITNTSVVAANVELGAIALSGAQPFAYQILNDGCSNRSIGMGQNCNFEVNFKPEEAGLAQAEINIPSNIPSSPTLHAIEGMGIELGKAQLVFSPTSLDFDELAIRVTQSQSLTLQNVGSAATTISAVTIGGNTPAPFTQANTCEGKVLNSGETCSIAVLFTATEAGNFNAQVIVSSDSGSGKNVAQLFGSTLFVDQNGGGCSLSKSDVSAERAWIYYGLILVSLVIVRLRKKIV